MAGEWLIGAIAAALALTTAPAQTPAPPEGIVWLALHDINALRVRVEDPTNHPPLATRPPLGMIVALDISPDGRPDWLIDYEAAGEARWCGTGGCRKRLYVSHGDGYVRAFDAQALALEARPGEGGGRLRAEVHRLYCVDDADVCRYDYVWDAQAGRLELVPAPGIPAAPADRFAPLSAAHE